MGHEYRFCRDEVEPYKKEYRLTSPKISKYLDIIKWQMRDMINKGKTIPISRLGIDGSK